MFIYKLQIKIIFIFFIFFPSFSWSDTSIIDLIKQGEKIIFIRHAYAPGNGDPRNFILEDCNTQRNLNIVGIEQSNIIKKFFKNNNIKIDRVLSSEWCRCKDTAKIAFDDYKTFNALNSFYDPKFANNESSQIEVLKKYIEDLEIRNNIVFITHYVVIYSLLKISTQSGEIIVTNKNLKVLGRKKTLN